MSQQAWLSRVGETRFRGMLTIGRVSWQVHFLDVSLADGCWVVECLVAGPRVISATIRCRATTGHGDTARRVMTALRRWLASGEMSDEVHLEATNVLERAS
jgi:hypothetical protein